MGDFWKPTADLFGALIDKPKMTQKLLVKPPFKYLFDIIAQTLKKTGFANGLFTAQEQNADFYSDKDKKIAYLQKVIKLVEVVLGSAIQAKPQKIVAGLQPQATNDFLQKFHACATSGKPSQAFVNKVLGKAQPQPQKKQASKPVRPPSAARIKKPAQAPSKPARKQEQQQAPPPPPVVEQKPVKMGKIRAQQKYSQNVQKIKAQAEQQAVAAQKQPKEEQGKGKNLLGKLGGGKKKKQTSQKLITSGGDLTEKQLELVQNMIQSICQNTAPLGKSIQFINDDIDAMNKELTGWRKQYNASKAKTQNELKITEETLLPVYDKIREIEEQILDQKAKIQTTKAQILKNDSTISALLMSVVTTK